MLERELIVVDASGDSGKLLVGKDGGIKERRTEKFEIEELFAIIDAMPMRIREMHERE